MSGDPRNAKMDWSLHFDILHTLLCQSLHASFVDFVLLFSLHCETTKAKFIFQEDGLDKDGQVGKVTSMLFKSTT